MDDGKSDKEKLSIRNLYQSLNEIQAKEAEENINRYLEIVLRIYDRIEKDPQAYARFRALTASYRGNMIDTKESNPT